MLRALAVRLGVVEAERRNGFRSEFDGRWVRHPLLVARQTITARTYLGGIPLRKLQTEQIEQLYAELLATGNNRTGEALTAKTVLEVHVILRAALGDAVRRGFLRNNPAIAAHAPKARRPAIGRQLEQLLQITIASDLRQELEQLETVGIG